MRSSSHVLLLSFWVVLPLSSLALRPARQEGDDDDLQACQGGDCGVNITKDDERVLAGDGANEATAVEDEALGQEVVAMDQPQAEEADQQYPVAVQDTLEFKAGQAPGVKLVQFGSGGADVVEKSMGVHIGHVKKIANEDVTQKNVATVAYLWANQVRGHQNYTVVLGCSSEGTKAALPLAAIGLVPMLFTATWSSRHVVFFNDFLITLRVGSTSP